MRLLAIDIGAGTQDVLLLDTAQPVENAVQLVLPSPTQMVARRIEEATRRRQPVLLTGVVMGGGANASALRRHLEEGLAAYATLPAALTFHDHPEEVAAMGVRLVSADEARRLKGVARIELKDLHLEDILEAVAPFTGRVAVEAVAVAVLDHGQAPPGVSNRRSRFQYLAELVGRERRLERLCYLAQELPPLLTRMRAVAETLGGRLPLLLMDTGTAAALGAGLDPKVARRPHRLSLNLGNAHTLGFHLSHGRIVGLFEHHTRLLTPRRLRRLVDRFLSGQLSNDEVWQEGGHGCLTLEAVPSRPPVTTTGPQRGLARGSGLGAYPAAPYGAMMLTGCYGLVLAWGYKRPEWAEEIGRCLGYRFPL